MNLFKPSLHILKAYYQAPAGNLRLLLGGYLEREAFQARQGITRVVYGVIRRQSLLDAAIHYLTERKSNKIEKELLIILRIGVYLLVFSESYKAYAVVNEAVTMARSRGKGFINAVLRQCSDKRKEILSYLQKIEDLPVKYSMTPLLIDHLKIHSRHLEADLQYLDEEPQFQIRINTRAFGYGEIQELLQKEHINVKELEPFSSFTVVEPGAGARLQQLMKEKKWFHFQNTASQLISIIAARYAKEAVLDCCAAPGTKSITLALMRPQLLIYASDINPRRLALINELSTAFELTNIRKVVADAQMPALKDQADFIVLDAPCTSSGTLRKNPDLKLKIDLDLIRKNAQQQYEMLKTVNAQFPSAYILYSVCSFIIDETEDVMSEVLNHPDHPGEPQREIIDLTDLLNEFHFTYYKGKYGFYLLPDEKLGNDLFYISLLKPAQPQPSQRRG